MPDPIPSAYDKNVGIDLIHAAVTIVAFELKNFFGGHTHLTFEYGEQKGYAGDFKYRHVVYHLIALVSGCSSQMCTGTKATVVKQINLGERGYLFAGKDAFEKAKKKYDKNRLAKYDESDFRLLKVSENSIRDMPNNKEWLRKKEHASKTIKIPTFAAINGIKKCRLMASGGIVEEIESKKFHKLSFLSKKGTTCMRFALNVLTEIGVKYKGGVDFWGAISPPTAIKLGKFKYGEYK